jgi:hypothetical protein
MDAPQNKKASWLRRLLERNARRVVDDVPEEIAACEFECRKLDCREGDWKTCARRLRGISGDTE